jgi:hypothetical protein
MKLQLKQLQFQLLDLCLKSLLLNLLSFTASRGSVEQGENEAGRLLFGSHGRCEEQEDNQALFLQSHLSQQARSDRHMKMKLENYQALFLQSHRGCEEWQMTIKLF